MKIACRDDIPHLLNCMGLTGDGVEIGVSYGHYSRLILERSNLRRLYSVDPYARECRGLPEDGPYTAMLNALAILRQFGMRSVLLRLDSLDAARLFRDHSLDFVYIDAKHDYDSVLADIAAWYPLVRCGGVIAGHDYEYGDQWPYVRRAVTDYFTPRNLEVSVTDLDGTEDRLPRHSWLVKKE